MARARKTQRRRPSTGPSQLRLLALSDLRVQDLRSVVEWVRARRQRFDLILYAGDDITRFRPDPHVNYFSLLAAEARYGLCAVAGNDDLPSARRLIAGPNVWEVHRHPLVLGRFVVIGLDGAPILPDNANLGFLLHDEGTIRRHLRRRLQRYRGRLVVLLSHAPPSGCLDFATRFGRRNIGSPTVAATVRRHRRIRLVVCGHAHISGGRHARLGEAVVVNAASHDDRGEPARAAVITFAPDRRPTVRWHTITVEHPLREIDGIGPTYSSSLMAAGIRNTRDLVAATPEKVATALGWRRLRVPRAFIARARAHHECRPVVYGELRLPDGPHVYFDIETDLAPPSYVWLIGCYDEATGEFKQFLAPRPDAEPELLAAFHAYATELGDRLLLSFSSSYFDRMVTAKRLAAHGYSVPQAVTKSIDVFHPLHNAIALPTTGFGLKEIAKALGYRFRYPMLDGMTVALGYMACLREGRKVPEKFLRYNEDDVRALCFVVGRVLALVQESGNVA